MIKQKLKASFIHLFASSFIIINFLLVIFFIWYPSPYDEINGIKYLLVVLIGVDIVLGPLLTFILYKKNKPSLKFDLSIIVTIQLAALIYGMHAIYQGHPVYIVYAVDRFELIPAKDAHPERAKYDEFKVSTFWRPKLVYAKPPTDRVERNKLLFETVFEGKEDLERRSEYYEPIKKYTENILKRGIDPDILFSNADKKSKLKQFLAKTNKTEKDFAFLPLVGKEKDIVIAVSRESGEIAGTIDVYPWLQG